MTKPAYASKLRRGKQAARVVPAWASVKQKLTQNSEKRKTETLNGKPRSRDKWRTTSHETTEGWGAEAFRGEKGLKLEIRISKQSQITEMQKFRRLESRRSLASASHSPLLITSHFSPFLYLAVARITALAGCYRCAGLTGGCFYHRPRLRSRFQFRGSGAGLERSHRAKCR